MSKLTPRDYQVYPVDCIFDYYDNGGTGNVLVAAPTGVGKSIMIALLIMELFKRYGEVSLKVMMLTHSKILIRQNFEKLLDLWPTAPAGICSDGLGRKDTKQAIIYGGIGTVANIPLYFGHVDIIIVDEAHMISLKESGQYRTFINDIKTTNPKAIVIGLTATKFRMGQGLLTEGEGALFDEIVCDMTTMEAFNWFLDQGYLARLRPVKVENEYDFTGVRKTAGEYNQADTAKAVDKPDVTKLVVQEAVRLGRENNCQSWLVFATGVKNTIKVWEELCRLGVNATYIHSNTKDYKMSDAEVEKRLLAYLAGEYECIVNNGILTTGFDHPRLDYIIFTRKTMSVPLWVQMLGRGTRPFYAYGYDLSTREGRLDAIANSDKPYCLVADFAGNCRELGPINDPQIPKPRGGKKEPGVAPIRICDKCGTYNHASATQCSHCGTEFPRLLKINVKVAQEELIREAKPAPEIKVEKFKVKRVEYNYHTKPGRPPSIRVVYRTATGFYQEWVALEHGGGISSKARNWWTQRCDIAPPETTIEALRFVEHLKVPAMIHVRTDNRRKDIINYEFEKELVETD